MKTLGGLIRYERERAADGVIQALIETGILLDQGQQTGQPGMKGKVSGRLGAGVFDREVLVKHVVDRLGR